MADKTGVARLRQAIKNQRDAGEGEFHLTYHDAEEIAAEIEDEHHPTCEDVGDGWMFRCSVCGCELDVDDKEGEPTMWLGGKPYNASLLPKLRSEGD